MTAARILAHWPPRLPGVRHHFHLGPVAWTTTASGHAVYLFLLTVCLLALSGVAVAVTGRAEVRRRWVTWLLIAPVAGLPVWLDVRTTALLAAGLAIQGCREYAALVRLQRAETTLLLTAAVAMPAVAWLHPSILNLTPLFALGMAVPALVRGDADTGMHRAAFAALGLIWIPWSLAHLVLLRGHAFELCFAAAAADVAAWCGGKGLRSFPGFGRFARRPLSPLSPNKTVGGAVGALLGAAFVLWLLGMLTLPLVVAVGCGGVAGDLLESMVKRGAGVKDAGSWLPGFGGLLDRIDSLLIVLPLAAALS